jgi:hypothetical protein
MSTSKQHKATPVQWEDAGAFASATRACLLELRARIEALEACDKEDANCWSAVRASMHALRERVEALETDQLEQAKSIRFYTDAIIRRVEALEAAQPPHQDKLDRLIALDADDRDPIVVPSPPAGSLVERNPECLANSSASLTSSPAGSLVERVAEGLPCQDACQARAAILEVAAWLTENYASDAYVVGPPPHQMLRNEANR